MAPRVFCEWECGRSIKDGVSNYVYESTYLVHGHDTYQATVNVSVLHVSTSSIKAKEGKR